MTMHIEGAGVQTASNGLTGAALVRLLTWMSPAFPVGAFSYSHGLETAIDAGTLHDRVSTRNWLIALVKRGGGWSDSVMLALSWKAVQLQSTALLDLNDHALAMAPSAERYMETTQQGAAFLQASRTWPCPVHDMLDQTGTKVIALPVILGAVAQNQNIALETILPAAIHAFAANLISVAMRLVPLGQSDGLLLQAALEPIVLETAQRATTATLEDIGSCCLHSDIAAMQHEHLTTRIFRS
ncbi:urease accessory protein UreF [Cohaesibacter celericrescens]|uniref:Urease accessory protein UreF n=1 Tax=Cohaesibacter celericrescens TaxID=2067669 RepID=A0A2N5XUU7_9HYPH|nr:urease accessory protein UreF [Cohaesibacter celericrescens]PLW78215.1 urease accessory protein UreF [Cohaesibacter celericrescens]